MLNEKNNDMVIIKSICQAVRVSSLDFCRALNDLAGYDSEQTLRTIIDGLFRMAKKLSKMQMDISDVKEEYVCPADVHEYLNTICKIK